MEKEHPLPFIDRIVIRTRKIITSPEFLLGLVTGGAYIVLHSATRKDKTTDAAWDEMENRVLEDYGDQSFPVMDRNKNFYVIQPNEPEE